MTPPQSTPLLQLLADIEKEEAMARVEANADPEWLIAALDAVRQAAIAYPAFIADDIWKFLDTIPAFTHDGRALGPVMVRAAKRGYIEKTDTYLPSYRRHKTPQRVWRSLLYQNERLADHG